MPTRKLFHVHIWRRQTLAAAVAAAGLMSAVSHADVTATWTGTGLGYWTTTADWSTSPQYPQNGKPSGTGYQVSISSTVNSTTVEILGLVPIAVDGVDVGQNADLMLAGGTLTLGDLNLSSGGFSLAGGTLSGGAGGGLVNLSSPAQFQLLNGTLDNLTFSGSNLVSNSRGTVKITNGLNLSGNTLSLENNSGSFVFYNSQTIDDLSIDGTGSTPASLYLDGSSGQEILTLGPNAIVHGNLTFASMSNADTLLNNGTLNADIASQTLSIENSNFTNNATAQATNGGTLNISASNWNNATSGTISANASTLTFGCNWNNAGTITTSGASTVNLGGAFTMTSLGAYTPSSNTTTNITGIINNAGNTLTLSGVTGTWNLNGGTIAGGIVAFGNNLNILNGTFSGVTIPTTTVLNLNTGDTLNLTGSSNNAGTIILSASSTLNLGDSWNNTGTINATGAATLNLGGAFSTSAIGSLNLAANTSVNITGTLDNSGSTVPWGSQGKWTLNGGTINNGTLAVAPGQNVNVINGTLNNVPIPSGANVNIAAYGNLVLSGSWTNQGNISGAGSIILDGTFAPSAIGNVNLPTGGVALGGTLNIGAGNAYELTCPWELAGGTISGGTLIGTGASPLILYYGGTLNGVTLNTPNISTPEDISAPLTILNNLTGTGQAISIINYQRIIFDGASQHISNINLIVDSYGSIPLEIGGPTSSGAVGLTIDANTNIEAGLATGQGGVIIYGLNNHGTLTNNGALSSYGEESDIYIEDLDAFNNNGTMTANGGIEYEDYSMNVESTVTNFTNNGMISTNNGSFAIQAANWTNAPGAAISVGSGSFLALSGTATNQSAINVSGNIEIEPGASFTNDGMLTLNSGSTARINAVYAGLGSLVANGLIYINASSTAGPISGNGSLLIGSTNGNPVVFQLNPNTGLSTQGALTVASNSKLDITNNQFIINYGAGPDPIASIAAMIISGYNGGSWNGTGITSSTAQTNSASYAIGYADSADPGNPANLSSGTIEIMYTLLGDANLDGKVNGTDFNLMAANFNQSVTNGWDEGDFNYDGKVNGNDFVLLAANFNQFASQSAVSAADLAALDSFATANGISLANVPEPASTGMLLLVGAGILYRRRRSIHGAFIYAM